MGLDNGIILKTKNNKLPRKYKKMVEIDYSFDDDFSIVYNRKWWGVRNDIHSMFSEEIDEEKGILNLTPEMLEEFIKVYKSWDDKYRWDNEMGSPIWTYEDVEMHIKDCISNIEMLIKYMKRHKNNIEECYWYDSY